MCIADFGVARALAEATWTEPAGAVLGTARYAAPEQVRGASLDGKADVYALALVLVEAVTGAVPFAADTTIATLMGRVDRPLPVGDELGPLAPVLRQAGRPDPADRPAADELVRTLVEAGATTAAADAPFGRPLPRDGSLRGEPGPHRAAGPPCPLRRRAGRPWSDPAPVHRSTTGPSPAPAAPPTQASSRADSVPSGPARCGGERPGRRRPAGVTVGAWALLAARGPGDRRRRRRGGGEQADQADSIRFPPWSADPWPTPRSALQPLHLHLRVHGQVFDERVRQGPDLRPATRRHRSGCGKDRPSPSSCRPGRPRSPCPTSPASPPTRPTSVSSAPASRPGRWSTGPTTRCRPAWSSSWTGQGGQIPKGSPDRPGRVHRQAARWRSPTSTARPSPRPRPRWPPSGWARSRSTSSTTRPPGQVVGTTPADPAVAVVGSPVTVTVSKGPDLVTVPNVVGLGVQTATASMESAGLSVVAVVGSPDRPVTPDQPGCRRPRQARVGRQALHVVERSVTLRAWRRKRCDRERRGYGQP